MEKVKAAVRFAVVGAGLIAIGVLLVPFVVFGTPDSST